MKVLCFGSLNIDYTYRVDHFVGKGETLLSQELRTFSGGKGLNQSLALARAGMETCHAGAIGEDGLFLLQELREAGVDTSCVDVRKDVRTGHAIIQNSRDGDNCILLYGGANQSITTAQADAVLSRFRAGDVLVLQNEINELPYIMTEAHHRGMKIVLNPSPMNEKIFALPLETVDYLLVNEVEAGQILGREVDKGEDGLAVAAALHERFPAAAVLLTLGERGSCYDDGTRTARQCAVRVRAVDTTAAGDTYTGFFLAGILGGGSVSEAMELAARASAIAVTRRGAAPSIPTRAEVLAWEGK